MAKKKRIPGRARPGNQSARKHEVPQDTTMQFRLSTADKTEIANAAERSGQKVGPWALSSLLKMARKKDEE